MSHESERVWDLFVITVGIFFLLLAWTPLVLSFTFPKLKLAPGSQAGPVFMSLRLGQYFSVEPDRRDPLYKTLTKNRQPPCPQARGPPAPCVEHSPGPGPAQPRRPPALPAPGPLPPSSSWSREHPEGSSAPWLLLESACVTYSCPEPCSAAIPYQPCSTEPWVILKSHWLWLKSKRYLKISVLGTAPPPFPS